MIDRTTKLRWRRNFRRSKRQVGEIGTQAEEQFERHFFRRLSRLPDVRRFVAGWLALLLLLVAGVSLQLRALGNYYEALQPVPGGTYNEGMMGAFTNASPLFATGLVDTTVSRLVFAGLLKYDERNHLVGDLAEKWQIDATGKIYTFTLRPNLTWQDGEPVTAADVAFTFQTIQNADAKSPLFHGWQGITIKKIDQRTVSFTLSSPLAPFIYSLTTGIVPQHLLGKIPPAELRSATFNTAHPVGAGPFSWETIQVLGEGENSAQQIGLQAFAHYHGGQPKLDQFVIHTYATEAKLAQSFNHQEINAFVGLDQVPDTVNKTTELQELSLPLTAETMVFLRTDSEVLKDAKVRQALVQAVNVPQVVKGLSYPTIIADEPLLHDNLGYNAGLKQLPYDPVQANKLLDDAGWKRSDANKPRMNGSTPLKIKFYAQNNADYSYITQAVQQAWRAVGVDVEVTLPSDTDLQATINNREYDALLYGVSIGTDPDVFPYWHSSQADPRATSRLNFSDYRSGVADKALESGRTRTDPTLRAVKYGPFLQAWRTDAPAVALYQPRFLYVTRGQLFGFNNTSLNTAADRFANIENWMIRQSHGVKNN
ncbi:MAG TPA: peptide ABC transporter substrate-binding protein [Patescibacteria group bacterium]|nr:peptide ABC transporter substrate-binding protein [Patescibacteria group bacterium]